MDDPRILIVPLANPAELRKSSSIELFGSPKNPYLFSEAVVVDAKDGRFGQTDFTRDGDPRYIKVSHKRFAFVTGEFDPGKGIWSFLKKARFSGLWSTGITPFTPKTWGPYPRWFEDNHGTFIQCIQNKRFDRFSEKETIWLE